MLGRDHSSAKDGCLATPYSSSANGGVDWFLLFASEKNTQIVALRGWWSEELVVFAVLRWTAGNMVFLLLSPFALLIGYGSDERACV